MIVSPSKKDSAVALLIVLFMVSFLLVIITATSNALFGLKRDIRLVERKQKERWAGMTLATNAAVAAPLEERKP